MQIWTAMTENTEKQQGQWKVVKWKEDLRYSEEPRLKEKKRRRRKLQRSELHRFVFLKLDVQERNELHEIESSQK